MPDREQHDIKETVMENQGLKKFASSVAILYALFHLYTAYAGPFPSLVQRSLHVGFALVLVFAIHRWKKSESSGNVPIMDYLLIITSAVSTAWVIINFDRYMMNATYSTTLDIVFGSLLVLVILEASRRVIGVVFPIMAVLAMAYAYFGPYFGSWGHRGVSMPHIVQMLYQSSQGIWGITTAVTANVVAIFIIFGAVLFISGGGKTFMDLSLWLAGTATGGPAKVATIASSLFGMLNGSAAANVGVTGNFTIPMMNRLGYKPEFAGAVEATASSGGQIMPPIMGAGAFIMAELLGISYVQVIMAATIPALLFYGGLFLGIHYEAKKLGMAGIDRGYIPKTKDLFTFKRMGPLVIPLVILITFIFSGYTAGTAGFWATASAVIFYLLTDFQWPNIKTRGKEVIHALKVGGENLILIAVLAGAAQIIVGMLGLTGLGVKVSDFIMSSSGGTLIIGLFFAMLVAIILGMGMPTTAAYLLAASVVGPPLIKLGVIPIAAHLFVFYFAIISAITPPVCAAVFVASGIAKSDWVKTAYSAMKLGLVGFLVPFLFVYSNELLMIGSPGNIILAIATAVLGVNNLASGVVGYLKQKLIWWESLLLVGSALSLMIPGIYSDMAGILVLAFVFTRQTRSFDHVKKLPKGS